MCTHAFLDHVRDHVPSMHVDGDEGTHGVAAQLGQVTAHCGGQQVQLLGGRRLAEVYLKVSTIFLLIMHRFFKLSIDTLPSLITCPPHTIFFCLFRFFSF